MAGRAQILPENVDETFRIKHIYTLNSLLGWIRSLFADFVNLNFYTNPITHSFPPEALTGTHPSHRC